MLGMIEKMSFVILICIHLVYPSEWVPATKTTGYNCHEDPKCSGCYVHDLCSTCHTGCTETDDGKCSGDCSAGNCFPGSSMVMTPTGNVAMETLNIGDSVLTVLDNEEMKFTKVVGFGQREPDKEAQFLSITTVNQAGDTQTVKLTATHNIYVKTKIDDDYIPRYAEDVSVGDVLKTQTDDGTAVNDATVTHVTLHKEMGAYAPLTETGTMLVDGTLVSCYASFNDNLAHLTLAPIRWFPWMFAEEKPLDGTLPYLATIKYIARNYVAPIVSLN